PRPTQSSAVLLSQPPSPHPALHSFPTRRSSDLPGKVAQHIAEFSQSRVILTSDLPGFETTSFAPDSDCAQSTDVDTTIETLVQTDRKSTRLNSSHVSSSYAVFCLKKKRLARSRH